MTPAGSGRQGCESAVGDYSGFGTIVTKSQRVELRGGVPWVMTSRYKYQTLRRVGENV